MYRLKPVRLLAAYSIIVPVSLIYMKNEPVICNITSDLKLIMARGSAGYRH